MEGGPRRKHAEQLAAARRQRRVGAVPGPLRPAVDGFASFMLASRERARRAGTVEAALATIRDLALFLASERGKRDWALADVHDIEAFLATLPRGRKRRLTVLRQGCGMLAERIDRGVIVNCAGRNRWHLLAADDPIRSS
jgi:hypothetical protein